MPILRLGLLLFYQNILCFYSTLVLYILRLPQKYANDLFEFLEGIRGTLVFCRAGTSSQILGYMDDILIYSSLLDQLCKDLLFVLREFDQDGWILNYYYCDHFVNL